MNDRTNSMRGASRTVIHLPGPKPSGTRRCHQPQIHPGHVVWPVIPDHWQAWQLAVFVWGDGSPLQTMMTCWRGGRDLTGIVTWSGGWLEGQMIHMLCSCRHYLLAYSLLARCHVKIILGTLSSGILSYRKLSHGIYPPTVDYYTGGTSTGGYPVGDCPTGSTSSPTGRYSVWEYPMGSCLLGACLIGSVYNRWSHRRVSHSNTAPHPTGGHPWKVTMWEIIPYEPRHGDFSHKWLSYSDHPIHNYIMQCYPPCGSLYMTILRKIILCKKNPKDVWQENIDRHHVDSTLVSPASGWTTCLPSTAPWSSFPPQLGHWSA